MATLARLPGTDRLGRAAEAGASTRLFRGLGLRGVRRGRACALDVALVARIQRRLAGAPVAFRLWDGTDVPTPYGDPVATLRPHDRGALLGLAWNPELYFGEAYAAGRLDVDGDLAAFLETEYRWTPEVPARTMARRLRWARWRRNTAHRARHDIHHHYDLGNDFYRLWLDPEMQYTCAYYPTQAETLDRAQIAKMELVCRKLQLEPGVEVVEAGCGWGGLALYMARRYGVHVRAYNISGEQIRFARARARAEGLTRRVEFIEEDYRGIEGTYDVFVSVGMLEHVGLDQYAALRGVIGRCLRRGRGRGLLHFIGRSRPTQLNAWIRKRIFPGAYPPTLGEVCGAILEPLNLAVLDVENLRLHYARTLAAWRRRFDTAEARIAELFDETFVRTWRLYLAGSEVAFLTGSMQLFQVTFGRPDDDAVAWTRVPLYAGWGSGAAAATGGDAGDLVTHADAER